MSEERYLIEKYHKELLRLMQENRELKRQLDNSKDMNKILIKYILGGNNNDSTRKK